MSAMKNAQLLKERYPDIDIVIHYIDIRASGEMYEEYYERTQSMGVDLRASGEMYEEYYERTQSMGVDFIRGKVAEVLEDKNGSPMLRFEDTLECEIREEPYDLVVLSTGMESNIDDNISGLLNLSRRISPVELIDFFQLHIPKCVLLILMSTAFGLLNLSRRTDRFLSIAHPKMRPVDSHVNGVFIAGCASGPKEIQVAIAQGSAAAAKTVRLLNKGELETDPLSAHVDPDKCIGCKLCEDVCKFSKIHIVDKKAVVDELSWDAVLAVQPAL
jgi:heterodisulfide reductase subunit A